MTVFAVYMTIAARTEHGDLMPYQKRVTDNLLPMNTSMLTAALTIQASNVRIVKLSKCCIFSIYVYDINHYVDG